MSDAPLPAPEALGRARRVRGVVVHLATGALALGATAAVTTAATLHESDLPSVVVPGVAVDVPAPPTQLVCPGPVRLPTEPDPGGDVAYDPQFDPTTAESVTTVHVVAGGDGTATLQALGDPGGPPVQLAPAGAAATVTQSPVTGTVVRAEPVDGGDAPWAAGVVGVVTPGGDLRGTVAASCQRPTTEAWLVGGSTALGSSARLVLQNPGRTAASVSLELWGPVGAVEVAGAPEFLVPAGQERVVLLEGVAAEQRRIVVRLTVAGGLVAAYVQDSELRGLVPAGVDHVVAGAPPASTQVLQLDVPATAVDGADSPQLRLLTPGDERATARVTLLGARGAVELPGTGAVDLDPGVVVDVPLGGLPAGSWTAVVEADAPVVAGALLTRGVGVGAPEGAAPAGAPLERAWSPSLVPGVPGTLALPPGIPGHLVLGALPGSDAPVEAEVEVVAADGAVLGRRTLVVAPGTTQTVPLAALPQGAVGVDGAPAAVAAVRMLTEDPRLVWSAVLVTPDPVGSLVSVVAPVRQAERAGSLEVRVR